MSKGEQTLKWIGLATVVFSGLVVVGEAIREAPGGVREVKIQMMGHNGGWKKAH